MTAKWRAVGAFRQRCGVIAIRRAGAIGLGFAVAGASFFAMLAARGVDPRLALAGWRAGSAVAAVLPWELEGTLVVIVLIGIQMSLPTASSAGPYTPLWSAQRLAEVAASGGRLGPPFPTHRAGRPLYHSSRRSPGDPGSGSTGRHECPTRSCTCRVRVGSSWVMRSRQR